MGARNHSRLVAGVLGSLLAAALSGACFWEDNDPSAPTPTPASVGPTVTAGATGAAGPTATATQVPTSDGVVSARLLYREGRYGDARAAFQSVADRTNNAHEQAEALLGAGNSAFALNDGEAGFEALRKAVDVSPPGSDVAVRARYLLLRHLNDEGRFEEAARLFNASASLAGRSPLEPYYRYEGARAQWWPVGNDIWLEMLRDPSVSAALKTTIRQELANKWRARGDTQGLATALDDLIADTADPAARFERAEVAFAAGARETAGLQLRAIVSENPASRYASLALALLNEAGLWVDPGAAGLAYYRRGALPQAVEVLLPSVDTAETANDLAFRAYYLAASYEDMGRAADAIRYYDLAAGSGATSAYVHRAKYWAARVSETSGTPAAASARYVTLVRSGPPGEFTQESAFRAGYVLFRAGDSPGAVAVWDGLSGAASARMEYWRGRALAEAGDAVGAKAAYARAVDLGPLDLYGLEAARELGQQRGLEVGYVARDLAKEVDWAAISSWLSQRIGGAPAGSAPTAACELMAAGLREAAAAEIWAADSGATTWRSFELMREASECGLTDVAARLAVGVRTDAGVASHEAPRDLLRVSYPLDFVATLDGEARKAGLDPLFLASLVRQESFWDPSAGSSAGALGLTQVIPPTGEALASELGVAEFTPQMLFQPAISLEFGAHYLAGQIARYGDPLVALAAYNAGPGNAARWSSARADGPADLVEVIDFVETKAYVTYIFEAYAHYRVAWGD